MEQHQLNIALRKNNHELKGSTIILTTYLKIVDMFSIEMDMFADINLGTIVSSHYTLWFTPRSFAFLASRTEAIRGSWSLLHWQTFFIRRGILSRHTGSLSSATIGLSTFVSNFHRHCLVFKAHWPKQTWGRLYCSGKREFFFAAQAASQVSHTALNLEDWLGLPAHLNTRTTELHWRLVTDVTSTVILQYVLSLCVYIYITMLVRSMIGWKRSFVLTIVCSEQTTGACSLEGHAWRFCLFALRECHWHLGGPTVLLIESETSPCCSWTSVDTCLLACLTGIKKIQCQKSVGEPCSRLRWMTWASPEKLMTSSQQAKQSVVQLTFQWRFLAQSPPFWQLFYPPCLRHLDAFFSVSFVLNNP